MEIWYIKGRDTLYQIDLPMKGFLRIGEKREGFLVGWLVGRSVCHYFLKGREVTLRSRSYRSTRYIVAKDSSREIVKKILCTYIWALYS